jgi:hypothetical protein
VGPSLGGYLVEALGFRQATVIFQIAGVLMLVLDVLSLTCFPSESRNFGFNLQLKKVGQVKVDLYERLP